MLTKRVIPCLDVRNGRVTKGVKFKNNVDLGDPVEMAVAYSEGGADELVFYDITASAEHRPIDLGMVEDDIRINGNRVSFSLIFDRPNDPLMSSIKQKAAEAVKR